MKVLMINGSPHKSGCTYTALNEISSVLESQNIDSEILYLGKTPLQGCTDCGSCGKTQRCVFDDAVNGIIDRIDEFDAVIAGTPVYYGAASGQITCFLDRLFFAAGSRMAGKPAASIVSCRRGGASSAFDQLNKYFTISSMPLVSSQYWNQVHGFTPDEVKQDLEGLQTMRTLGQNMAWLLKCIEAGRAAGVPYPVYEKRIFTNFID